MIDQIKHKRGVVYAGRIRFCAKSVQHMVARVCARARARVACHPVLMGPCHVRACVCRSCAKVKRIHQRKIMRKQSELIGSASGAVKKKRSPPPEY